MITLWNTPIVDAPTVDALNKNVRAIGLERDGKQNGITNTDIIGEAARADGTRRPGAIQGLTEYLGLSSTTVRRMFAAPGKSYAKCLPDKPAPILALYTYTETGEQVQLPQRPGMVGRRVYDLSKGSPSWYSRQTTDKAGKAITDAPPETLRKRAFMAALLGGELRREPIFHGKTYIETDRQAYRSLADVIEDAIQNVWLGGDTRFIMFAWISMHIEQIGTNDPDTGAVRSWRLIVEYNQKDVDDTYEELETDNNGGYTGKPTTAAPEVKTPVPMYHKWDFE